MGDYTASEEHLLSVQEVAEIIGIPVATLYHWRSRGKGPRGFRAGKYVRFRRQDVDAWIDEQLQAEAETA